ncbi:helix-turn-helix domain-containing protein [Pseudoduganella sp. FT93W]|uniref:Helix-turn-helix domain-containing protein n=1 Tax=Duganella fentianensis TaxID=2692177 RepID=A0A845I3Z9_9BURK|nr:helix-turn-helix transcriptional regulator [Duganella fentianensis]MYN45618.1 helix-turn-helix domain-containing protein [Duganella fentianensis]
MELLATRTITHSDELHDALHSHAQGQLFCVQSGVVSVQTETGRWLLPPGCLGWVPPWQAHAATSRGPLQAVSRYFDETGSRACMPATLTVVRSTPLLQALLDGLPAAGAARQHYLQTFAHALGMCAPLTGFLPMPGHPALQALVQHLLQHPADAADFGQWAQRCHMSRRTLTRRFSAETGWSLGLWHRQMRLQCALEQLAHGLPVTTVAFDCGYQSVSAFIAVFRARYGLTPRAWQLAHAAAPAEPHSKAAAG